MFEEITQCLKMVAIMEENAYSSISTAREILILDMDASNESVDTMLSQEIDGNKQVIAYWSKYQSKPEQNYCTTRKVLLAIIKAVEHFHQYLYGRKFLLWTDHGSVTWLLNFRNP